MEEKILRSTVFVVCDHPMKSMKISTPRKLVPIRYHNFHFLASGAGISPYP